MEDIRYPKQVPHYRSIGTGRRLRRPLKKLLDGYSREDETGHLLVQLRDQKKKNEKSSHMSQAVSNLTTGWTTGIRLPQHYRVSVRHRIQTGCGATSLIFSGYRRLFPRG